MTVSDNGRLLDLLEFDAVNVLHHDGAVAMIHRDVMRECVRDGLWYHVAHAAAIVADRGSLLDAWEAMTKEAHPAPARAPGDRLAAEGRRDRSGGAASRRAELGLELGGCRNDRAAVGITYQTVDRQPRKTGPVIHMDEHMTCALTAEGMHWLYDSDESEKVRFLGD